MNYLNLSEHQSRGRRGDQSGAGGHAGALRRRTPRSRACQPGPPSDGPRGPRHQSGRGHAGDVKNIDVKLKNS